MNKVVAIIRAISVMFGYYADKIDHLRGVYYYRQFPAAYKPYCTLPAPTEGHCPQCGATRIAHWP